MCHNGPLVLQTFRNLWATLSYSFAYRQEISIKMLLKIVVTLCFANAAWSQPNTSETFNNYAVLDSGEIMHLYWKLDDTHIVFEIHGNTTGWVGIGISPGGSMVNSDIYVGWVKNGVPMITDRHGDVTNGYPPLDAIQNANLLVGFEQDGWTVIKFRRPLVTCDNEDLDITGDTLRIIYAWNSEDPSGNDLEGRDYHGTLTRGVKSLMLLEPTRTDENIFPEGETHYTFDLVNDNMHLPAVDTYYNCRLLKMPELTTKHHLVKVEPIVQKGHELNIHHILVYQCTDDANIDSEKVDHECYQNNMPPDYQSCQFVVMAWAIGGGAFHYPKHTGFPLGVPGAPKYVVLEMHYDNPDMKTDIIDSSGLRIYYTPDLRQYDAGIMEIGHTVTGFADIIPPQTESFLDVGECSSNCLGNYIKAEGLPSINVFGILLHSHLLGRNLTLKHIRNGTELANLAKDSSYDFNLQEARFLAEERSVLAGDAMQMICDYNSIGRADITMGGLSTKEEMCMSFVYYYPKIPLTFCQSAPNWYSLMTYFGITDFEYVDDNGVPDLHDFIVLAPPEYANKTAYEVVNDFQWDEESAAKFSLDAKSMLQSQLCASTSSVPDGIKTFITPLTIDVPYVDPANNCTETSTPSEAANITSSSSPDHWNPSTAADDTNASTQQDEVTDPDMTDAKTTTPAVITTTTLGSVDTTSSGNQPAVSKCIFFFCSLSLMSLFLS